MAKPKPTLADYFVIALSPALIITLVGSLCFFLIDIRYQGKMEGVLCWVMFWFVLAIVLISRIAIEQSAERAALFGIALGAALWLYLIRTSPAYLLAIVLMALVWYCAHRLVWDCTLIDDDQDSSGQGLLGPQKAEPTQPKPQPAPVKKTAKLIVKQKYKGSDSPGRSVLYFSLAALPLFGLGQVLLPANAAEGRHIGFALLVIYLTSALGLLVTTSFLGLRRYLRQRYLEMPISIAFAWVKFGAGVAVFILMGAMLLPRPGVGVAWDALRTQVDHRLRQASQYASGRQPSGTGKGRAGEQAGNQDSANGGGPKDGKDANTGSDGKTAGDQNNGDNGSSGDNRQSGQDVANPPSPPAVLSGPAATIYNLLRKTLLIVVAVLVVWWLYRCRYLFLEMFNAMMAAIRKFLALSIPRPSRSTVAEPLRSPPRPLAEFKNPFFSDRDHSRPPEEIILYTFDALRSWAQEQGIELHPEQTPREFCQEMEAQLPEVSGALHHLSYLHAHAAYGWRLPANCDMEPLKELWRRLTWNQTTR